MTLEVNTRLGEGGIGLNGKALGSMAAMVKELQGLTFSKVTGGAANTKYNLAAIRTEDTPVMVLNNAAGAISEIGSTFSIVDLRATGTVVCAAAVAADTVTVNGKVYTAIANGAVPSGYTQFSVGAGNTSCGDNLVAAVNAREKEFGYGVQAANVTGTVTFTAVLEGVAGNSLTLASSNGTRLAVSGATLANGSATGGIRSTGVTNEIWLLWFNKRT